MRLALPFALAALALACDRGPEPDPAPSYPAFEPRPVLSEWILETEADALPRLSMDRVDELRDLLDAIGAGGRLAHSATGQLEGWDAKERTAGLLSVIEELKADLGHKRTAYAWLRDTGTPGLLPRLTLRLKYEKDLWSAVCLSHTLLLHGNGAGLDAIAAVLEREPRDASEEAARSYAATVIPLLPASEGWEPGADFAADWARLTEVRGLWARERLLSESEEQPAQFAPEVHAEMVRMSKRLTSQPLRPVDDARFVLTRQRGAVVSLLEQLSHDENRYLSEHALQTLSWMGVPVHAWCLAHDFDYVAALRSRLSSPSLRARTFEALGAGRFSAAQEDLSYWLLAGTREESAAAADALLRCADASFLPTLQELIADAETFARLPAEARFSLYTLQFELEPELEAEYPPELFDALPEGERERRTRWASERL